MIRESALEAAEQLLVESVSMFEQVVARGVMPGDLKIINQGLLDGRVQWLDAGLMGESYCENDLCLICQRFAAMIHRTTAIHPELGAFYARLVAERGYGDIDAVRKMFEQTFGTKQAVSVPDVLPFAFEVLPAHG